MALGIGANAAILSVVDATRLRPLPFDDAASLMEVWLEPVEPADPIRGELTGADLGDLRAEPGLFAALAGWRATTVSYVGLSSQEVLKGAEITAGMFSGVLRVQPFLGRTFLPEEDRAGATPAVLLSHAFWSEHFGGDPKTIGRSVVLDGTPHVVVGVMPPGLRTPFRPGAEVWTPARLEPRRCRSGCTTVSGVGRLASGTRLEVARDRALALGQRLAESYP
ncbi:MAG: ABC transporter permease, partial [Gemmatimonadetes bacterium]|nr:ABC transporter permease [Gemmatimonadota bacterium]